MLFNVDFASNTVLSSFFFFYLIIYLYSFVPAATVKNFNPIAELQYKQTCTFKHKIKQSNTKLFTHYRNVCLYAISVCYSLFVSYEFFNFSYNMFNSKAIKIYCIVRCSPFITIHIQSYPMSSY